MLKIRKIKLEQPEPVYDITVSDTHCFYANDILVHNCEILLPTKPLINLTDESGRIQLCTLSNINWGAFSTPQEMEEVCYYVVRYLDNILSLQDYPMPQAKTATEEFRPLGIGVNNLAYFLAKNNCKYGDEPGLVLVDEWMQHQAYYCQKASIQLAKERGPCTKSHTLRRSKGIMVIDQYKKTVDELVPYKEYLDWDQLRRDAILYGVRNATLTATPPSESNSQVIGATNGAEPVRAPIVFKDSKDGSLVNIIPQYKKLKNQYDYLWDMTSPVPYLNTIAVLQKWHDMTISTNFSYNPAHYPENKVPMSTLIGDFLHATRYGIVTGYYHNFAPLKTAEPSDHSEFEEPETHAQSVYIEDDVDSDCAACKL